MDTSHAIRQHLLRFRNRVRSRHVCQGLLWFIASWLALLLLLGLADALFAFETAGRLRLATLLALGAVLGFIVVFVRSRRFSLQDAARRVDAVTGDTRGLAGIGSDLSSNPAPAGLEGYLARRTLNEALQKLETLPGNAHQRRGEFRRGGALVAGVLVLLLGIVIWEPQGSLLVVQRLLQPSRELPPFSRYQFDLDPKEPRVIYGKTLPLAVEISGAALNGEDVQLLTRPAGGGDTDRLPVFRESGSRFAQKLEGVTTPLEVAFAVGRARSAWTPVEILWQPQLERTEATVTPPRYARRKPVSGPLTGEIQGLRGAEVVLRLSSNRPLSGGVMEAVVDDSNQTVEKIMGTPSRDDPRTAEFRWVITRDCRWTLDLSDIRGTRMAEPVRFTQRLQPDEKPSIDVVAPGPFAMATPSSTVDLEWQVSDDLGLDRASWVRTADGYRDRSTPLPGVGGEQAVEVRRDIQLASLGVTPGQTLEFLVEARDHNPNLMGVGTSTPVRVQIISEEDYAEQIRVRTTIEEFAARYQVLREALDAAARALEELAEAAATGDREKIEAARQRALNRQRQAAEWFGQFADDFPAFATDKQLSELSGDLQEELEKNAQELSSPDAWKDPAKAQEMARAMRERLNSGSDKLAEQEAMAQEFAKIAGVMEMAAELDAIHQEQRHVSENLARIAEELAVGMTNNRHKIAELRQRQLQNEARLQRVQEELPKRLENLPESAAKLKAGAEKVLEGLENFEVSKQMGDAVAKIGNGNLLAASNDALLARGNLDQILGQPDNPFCDMCQGQMPGGMGGGGLSQQEALAQMMGALRRRAGEGDQNGGGAGSSGQGYGAKGGSGSSMAGTQLPIPLLGPSRLKLDSPNSVGSRGDQTGQARQGTAPGSRPETATNQLTPGTSTTSGQGQGPSLDEVPLKYREAVKNYFSKESPAPPAGEEKR